MTPQNIPFYKDLTVYDVMKWLRTRSENTIIGRASFRGWHVALEQLVNLIADDESKDVQWVHMHLNQLRERWCRRNPRKRAMTAHTYASRARRAIKQYLKWLVNPEEYTFFPRKNTVKPKPVSLEESSKLSQPKKDFCEFSLEEGTGTILFKLPERGITKADIHRFEMHLLTFATDFEVSRVLEYYRMNKDPRVSQLVRELGEEA